MEDIVTNCLKYSTVGKKSKRENVSFSSEGANWVFSFDNHVKFMGPQNGTFPIAIYSCRKLVWIKVWDSNSSPYLLPHRHYDYLPESKLLQHYVRLDNVPDSRVLGTMHAYLWKQQFDIDTDDEVRDTVIYGHLHLTRQASGGFI